MDDGPQLHFAFDPILDGRDFVHRVYFAQRFGWNHRDRLRVPRLPLRVPQQPAPAVAGDIRHLDRHRVYGSSVETRIGRRAHTQLRPLFSAPRSERRALLAPAPKPADSRRKSDPPASAPRSTPSSPVACRRPESSDPASTRWPIRPRRARSRPCAKSPEPPKTCRSASRPAPPASGLQDSARPRPH